MHERCVPGQCWSVSVPMASDLSRTEWFRVLSDYVKNALVERTQTRESALFSKCA